MNLRAKQFLSVLSLVVFALLFQNCSGGFEIGDEVKAPSSNDPGGTPDQDSPPISGSLNSARVFISGHSLTDNPLPDHMVHIAAQHSDDFNWNQQNIPGSPIRVRTYGGGGADPLWAGYSRGKNKSGNNMNIVSEIRNPSTIGAGRTYDHLIITDRHDILDVIEWESTAPLLRHYHNLMRSGNANAKTLFYHSWLDVDKSNSNLWINHEKLTLKVFECVSAKVNLSLQTDGLAQRVSTLPAGGALVDLVERALAGEVSGITGTSQARLNAIFSDNVHMTNLGSYYLGLVSHATVFRKSSVGTAAPAGINAATAADLQEIAWNYVSTYLNSYVEPSMASCRTLMDNQYCNSYHSFRGNSGNVNNCRNHYIGANSPFRWPDANWVNHAAP